MSQSPWKLLKLANLKPAYPASPISPRRNHNKWYACIFPLFFLSPDRLLQLPPVTSSGPHPGNRNKLSVQWQASPHPLASPCVNKSKTYILNSEWWANTRWEKATGKATSPKKELNRAAGKSGRQRPRGRCLDSTVPASVTVSEGPKWKTSEKWS